MPTVMHLNLRVDPTQYIPQIRNVPGYDYIHLIRKPEYIIDPSLFNEKVYFLNEIFTPEDYVKKKEISLLHAHHAQLGILLLPFKSKTKLPLVTSIRGVDATLAEGRVGYKDHLKILFEKGEQFFPVCHFLADRMNLWGCPTEKMRVLYGGVDLSQFTYSPPKRCESQNILSVGRLVEKKGHHILMQAFKKIKDKYPRATLTIIGSGILQEPLKILASQLNLGDSFRLLSHLPKHQVHKEMSQADLFCAPSLEASDGNVEGIPNTIKEAMATGIPVISTTHAGIPELVTHNKEGILVHEDNVIQLAEALEFMLDHREKWNSFATAARRKVELQFDQTKQLQQQARFYDELLGGKK